MDPETLTDIFRDPDVGSSENMLPIPRTFHLGPHAITQATLTILFQVVFYAFTIMCILCLVSFFVECSGWLGERKRRQEVRKDPRPPRTSSKARSKSRHSDGSQKRSKPTQELKERKPRPRELGSQDQFDLQPMLQPVIDAASGQTEDCIFDHDPVILHTPDPQPVRHSFKTPLLRPRSYNKAESPRPSLGGRGRWPSPERVVSHIPMVPQKPRQIVPGDWVLRIRPPQTILKGTSDEADVYDGPWEVLKVEERHKVQHTPMARNTPRKAGKLTNNSSKASAKINIPTDSLLQRFSQGWIELEQLVKVDASLEQAVVEGSRSSFRGEDGEEYYQVKKVRGVKHEISQTPRASRNSGVGKVSFGSTSTTPTTKKYLVHWVGYPSEDDTWELSQKDQTGGVPVGYICKWIEREKVWKEAREYSDV